jgi:sulfatase maturation enzyme AslB (radical SAM superfamily)
MTRSTADKAVDLIVPFTGAITEVEFQGGEPLLNFELIRYIVDRVELLNRDQGRSVEFGGGYQPRAADRTDMLFFLA